MENRDFRELLAEVSFKASRSSGKGGQNVNKVSTRIELLFPVADSLYLSDEEKSKLLNRLKTKISDEGILRVVASEDRSQLANKKIAIEKFLKLIANGLKERIKRIGTKPTKASKRKRIETKKKTSEKKKLRTKKFPE